MAQSVEQIKRWTTKTVRKQMKKALRKKSRKLAKQLLEDAPTKITKGWAD